MKHILLILTIIFTLSCKAQDIVNIDSPLTPGKYLKDLNNVRANFVGIWQYTNGTTEFTLHIYNDDAQPSAILAGDFTIDKIIGNYIYKENGVEIINTTSMLTSLNNITASPFTGLVINGQNVEDYITTITDYGKHWTNYDCEIRHQVGNVEMEITNLNSGQPLQATFKVFPIAHNVRWQNTSCDNSQDNYAGWSFPTEMTLTKIANTPPSLD